MKKAVSILLADILALFCAVLPAFAYSSPFGLTEPDDPGEAIKYLDMGVNTILSNDYNRVARAVEEYKNR